MWEAVTAGQIITSQARDTVCPLQLTQVVRRLVLFFEFEVIKVDLSFEPRPFQCLPHKYGLEMFGCLWQAVSEENHVLPKM